MSYKQVMLISENTIKENLSLDKNVSYTYIAPIIKVVQDIRLQRVLGGALYDKVRQTVVDDPTLAAPENADIKVLVDNYIKDLLLYGIIAELQVQLSFKTRNLGVVSNNDLGATTTSIENVNYLKEYYLNYAKFYEERTTVYLCNNSTLYPEYNGANDDIMPVAENYSSPIFTGDSAKSSYLYK
jgi:hypothetical protein